MQSRISARTLLRLLLLSAVVLVGLDLLLLALRLGSGLPELPLPAGRVFAAVSVMLLAIVVLLVRRLGGALAETQATARQRQQAFDALDAGIVLFDAQRRIVLCNEQFRRDYARVGRAALPGASYEQLLHALVDADMVPEATGREQAWIAQRLAGFGNTGSGLMRRLPDGVWRRIVEQRLPDGGVLAHLVDVTDLVAQQQALDQARLDLQRLHQRLQDAVDAMPAGFELYDAEDRLVMVTA